MQCERCGTEMNEEEVVNDFQDPASPYSHGQTSYTVWICPKCKFEITEDEVEEDIEERKADEEYQRRKEEGEKR